MNGSARCRRIAYVGLAVVALALTAGCAVTAESRAKSAPGALQLAEGQGMIAMKVTSNRPAVSTFFPKWTTLRVKNLDRKEAFTIFDRSDSSGTHSLFVQALPPGTYAIEAVGNEASGAITIREGAAVGGAFPSFKIVSGQLTHLGTLTYIRRHFPIESRQFLWGQQDSPFDRDAILRQLEPEVASRLGRRPVLGWNDEAPLKERRAAFADSRRLKMRLLSPAQTADGSLIFGESFGQLAIRTRTGEWRWLQTPTALPIRSVHVLQGGVILAGSDDNILLKGSADGRQWESLQLPTNDASVIHIGTLPNTDRTLVVLQTRDKFVGLSANFAQPVRWQEEFSRPRALFTNLNMDAHGVILSVKGSPLLIAGSAEANFDSVAYDSTARTWKATQLSESGSPFGWVSLPNGTLGRFKGIPLTGMYFATSTDNGVTWEKRGALNWASGSLLFVSPTTGYVIRTDSIPAFNAEKFALSLWRTDDAGRSWNKVGPAPGNHGRLLTLGGTDELAYGAFNGKFFVSADGGKTWRLEREIP